MDLQSAKNTRPEAERGSADGKVSRLAAQTWLALQAIEVPPTPQNFGLWYIYLSGENPELTQRMDKLLQPGCRPEAAMLDLIYAECVAQPEDPRFEVVEDGAETMQQVVEETASQLAAGQRYLQDYGRVLAGVGTQLGDRQAVESLLETVRTLVAETTRAGELNRSLQARLQSSASQVQRLRQSLVEVRQDATTDALTGLVNRRGFDARLKRVIARRKLDDAPVCLLLADVDRFKTFNDTYGHKTGDLVLRFVARLLADNVKGKDTAARYGGEEFAIILTGADEHAGSRVAEQIRASLDGKRLLDRGNSRSLTGITISIGVAALGATERSADLIERADMALYRAKNSGRNKVCRSSDMPGSTTSS